jgi:deoxyribodipyrimidine photo-lyase
MHPTIVLFKKDLRLKDNPALHEAAKLKKPLLLVYIDDSAEHDMPIGKYQKIALHHSLESLKNTLKEEGHTLHFFKGNIKKTLMDLIKKTQADAIFWNRCYEPFEIKRDTDLKKTLLDFGLQVQTFSSYLLFEPWTVLNQKKEFFRVFTPFWKHLSQILQVDRPLSKPHFDSYNKKIDHLNLDDLNLLSKIPTQLEKYWEFGEEKALKKLNKFLQNGLKIYSVGRDFPAIEATSKLSCYLHLGEISPRQIVYETQLYVEKEKDKELKLQMVKFFSEIGWREFAYNLLYHFPDLAIKPFKSQYAHFPWKKNEKFLSAWKEGMTGFPIIDAGMRQLKQTGWMHNRIRMVVASFLIKNGMIHWHEGENWFYEHLVDADLANNSASWQWVFGSGADAAPYFRVFNPILQSEKFDPEGKYIKTYVPEVKDLDIKYLHDPSSAPKEALEKAKITLNLTYPKAICDLNETRDAVLKAYKHVQESK